MDMISSLPDDIIICCILSLLTTKEAVATSILSKRWTHLCHFVPKFDFTNISVNSDDSNSSFNKFVYSVLAPRDVVFSQFINSFCLDIQYGNPNFAYLGFPNIVEWINHVVQRRLEYLRLHLHVDNLDHDDDDDQPKLPINTLTSKTLVTLKLSGFHLEGFSLPSIGFGFPSLRTLHLRYIEFTDIQDFMLFLAGCPFLENLRLSDIFFPEEEEDSVTIQEVKSFILPKLTIANITRFWCSYFPMKALSKSECLCIDPHWFHIEYFVYEVNQPQGSYGDIPIFHNLTHLELHNSWDLVAKVLLHCPKVQHLELHQDPNRLSLKKNDQENWVEPELIPECLLSCLRTCIIGDFSGIQSEIQLAKYILKNSRNLESMNIWSKGEQPEIERKLSSCPKASITCKLLVH